MRKLSSNQRGFAPIIIVIIIAVLIVAGAVGYFVFTRDDPEPTSSNTETSEEADMAADNTFSGSYFDALERGKPLQCQWRLPEEVASEFQAGQGELYTDGNGRGYSTAAFEVQSGITAVFSVLELGSEYAYTWFTSPDLDDIVGTKIPMSQLESDYQGMSESEQQQAIDIRANYSFECEPWEVDESLLTPPNDVTFTEVNP